MAWKEYSEDGALANLGIKSGNTISSTELTRVLLRDYGDHLSWLASRRHEELLLQIEITMREIASHDLSERCGYRMHQGVGGQTLARFDERGHAAVDWPVPVTTSRSYSMGPFVD